MVTLANRHINVSGQCPTCGIGVEDTKHLLFTCAKAKEVLRLLGLDFAIDKACDVDHPGEALPEYLLLQPAEECVVLGLGNSAKAIAISSWYLRWERRKLVHNEKVQEPKFIAMAIRD